MFESKVKQNRPEQSQWDMKARLHVEDGGVEVLLRRAPLSVEVHPGQPLPRGAARHEDARHGHEDARHGHDATPGAPHAREGGERGGAVR